MKTRVAIVGLGKMGLMHASIMAMLENVELVAICEKSSFIRRFSMKVIPDVSIVPNLEDLYDMRLDAICITTPPVSHFPIIKTIYEKSIARNIFTEKPLAINYFQAKELSRLAEIYGGVNMVGYQRRFSVTSQKAKQILEAGGIGEPHFFKGHAYSADFLGAKSPSQAIARGGVLKDSGCHIIDLTFWLLGEMELVSAKIKSLLGNDSEDEAFLEVRTPSNLEGEIKVSWCKEGYRLPDIGLSVTGSLGTLMVNEDQVDWKPSDGKSFTWYKHDLNDFVPFFIGGAEYQRQDELFVKAIYEDVDVEPNFRTASRVEYLLDKVDDYTKG